jgi:hypothetical protein
MAQLERRASRGLLPAVADQQLLDLDAFLGAQLECGPRENVEDDQFLLGHVFADVALLLLAQVAA